MRKISFLLILILSVRCTTSHKMTQRHHDKGVWEGTVLVLNNKTKHKKWVSVNWVSDSDNQRMRIDVYAMLDIPVATYIKTGHEAHLWLFTERKYYHSIDDVKLFKQLTKMSVDPNLFFAFLGSPKPPSPQWQCKDEEGVMGCVSAAEKAALTVDYREPNERVIQVKRRLKTLKLKLSRSKVQVDESLFKVLSTSQFEIIEI